MILRIAAFAWRRRHADVASALAPFVANDGALGMLARTMTLRPLTERQRRYAVTLLERRTNDIANDNAPLTLTTVTLRMTDANDGR